MNKRKSFTHRIVGWSAVGVLVLAAAMTLGGCRKRKAIHIVHRHDYVASRRDRPTVIVVQEDRHDDRHGPRKRGHDRGRDRRDGPRRRR